MKYTLYFIYKIYFFNKHDIAKILSYFPYLPAHVPAHLIRNLKRQSFFAVSRVVSISLGEYGAGRPPMPGFDLISNS